MNNGGFLGFGRGAPTVDTAISRYIQSPVYYNSTTIIPPPGTKQIHVWLVGGGGGAGSWRRQRSHYHHNDYGQSGYQEGAQEAGGGGFGGAALFNIPVTTDPIVLTIGAGGSGPSGVGGASTITVAGVMVAKVGGGGAGAGNNDANQHSPGFGGRFGGGGSGGNRQTASSLTHVGWGNQHAYTAAYGTGSGGGEPPNSARGGTFMLSWLYPEGNTAWRATGHNAQTAQTDFPNYVNLTSEQVGDVKVPGSFVMPSGVIPIQLTNTFAHATQGHHAYSHAAGSAGNANNYTALYPFPLGTAFKPVINRDRTKASHHDDHHLAHQGDGSNASVGRGAFGWFGAGGWGGSGTDPQQTENQAEPNGFGAGGGAGGGQGNHGGGGGGPNLHQDNHNPAIGFAQSPGIGGSFTSTPHLWGLRTGQTTGPGGAGLFTPVTTQNGGAGGGGAGVQNSTQGSQQHTPGAQHVGWGTSYPHDTAQGGRAQGAPTGGGGCAVFRFYL